jgi:nickel-dependent lactate racemase
MSPRRSIDLRTGAWYGDRPLSLPIPDRWDVVHHWPAPMPELTDEALAERFDDPIDQRPIRQLASGVRRVVIIVDDLTRPTPVDRILPPLLAQLRAAGDPQVSIVVATGTHGPPGGTGLARKLGPAATGLPWHVHDDHRNLQRVGRTSFGTPVLVNRDVAAADLVIGIGGVYPQRTVQLGGGSKLALGVLGRRSIVGIHYGHRGSGGTVRQELDEMAELIRLSTIITAHVDGERRIVRMVVGDVRATYPKSAAFSNEQFRAPPPIDADVVVANTYPMDVSLTFACSKGLTPLEWTPASASRIAIAACSEGPGFHGLFPVLGIPRFQRARHRIRTLVARPSRVPELLARRLSTPSRTGSLAETTAAPGNPHLEPMPIHMLVTDPTHAGELATPDGMQLSSSWAQVLARVDAEHAGHGRLRAVVYGCAPLMVISEGA